MHPIIDVLSREALTADELAKALRLSVEEISASLSMLELDGVIAMHEGKYYCKK